MKYFFFLFTILTFTNVYSQETSTTTNISEYQKGFNAGIISKDSSAMARQNRRFEGILSYGADYTITTPQVMLSTFLTGSDVLGLKFGQSKQAKGDSLFGHEQTNVSVQYKRFVSNSFYIAPEIVYLESKTIDEDRFFYSDSRVIRSSNGIGTGLRIGNQWVFDNLTVGCDWFGLGSTVIHFNNKDSRTTYATLLNAYVGLTF